MPSVPYAGTARVTVHQSFYGDEAVNVFHLKHDEALPLSVAEYTAIANEFQTFYIGSTSAVAPGRGIAQLRHPNAMADLIRVYDLTVVPNPPPFELALANPGTGSHTKVPLEECCTVTLRTNVGTRRGRGRIFHGPLSDQCYSLSTASAAPELTPGLAGSTAFINAYTDLNVRLQAAAVLNNARLGVLSVADGVCRVVTSIRLDRRPDTQRRRELDAVFTVPVTANI